MASGVSRDRAAGETNPGLQRPVNEDRFYIDAARGVFLVVDGIGGQAAGGLAADIAVSSLRRSLELPGPITVNRLRAAIASANNAIFDNAQERPEWRGMACVLTIAVVDGERAIVGHVGDTRLYKLSADGIVKVTRDHSPVGEREDANEITESAAMRHPRRNEVYRDVGSDLRDQDEPEFVDVEEIAFGPDAALLLCSDGLSDLVSSALMQTVVAHDAGDPGGVARALVDAANAAGGSDNVTVVYVEGERFAAACRRSGSGSGSDQARPRVDHSSRGVAAVAALALAAGLGLGWWAHTSAPLIGRALDTGAITAQDEQVVRPSESIMTALAKARPGTSVVVEPGEYREQLVLRDRIRLVSRVPGGATLRLPAGAAENEAAVVAQDLVSAQIAGFRILGDAATPLGTGILVRNAALSIVDVEISGAALAAVDFSGAPAAELIGCDIHENLGAALAIRSSASPRIEHNSFARNALAEPAGRPLLIEPGANPELRRNVFHGLDVDAFADLDPAWQQRILHENVFPGTPTPRPSSTRPHR